MKDPEYYWQLFENYYLGHKMTLYYYKTSFCHLCQKIGGAQLYLSSRDEIELVGISRVPRGCMLPPICTACQTGARMNSLFANGTLLMKHLLAQLDAAIGNRDLAAIIDGYVLTRRRN